MHHSWPVLLHSTLCFAVMDLSRAMMVARRRHSNKMSKPLIWKHLRSMPTRRFQIFLESLVALRSSATLRDCSTWSNSKMMVDSYSIPPQFSWFALQLQSDWGSLRSRRRNLALRQMICGLYSPWSVLRHTTGSSLVVSDWIDRKGKKLTD